MIEKKKMTNFVVCSCFVVNGFGLNTLLQESKQIPKNFVMDTVTVKRTETIANSNPNPARTKPGSA